MRLSKRWFAIGLALAGGGGAAAVLPALPAVGQASPPSSPIVLIKTATVIDKGAVAKPSAYVVCPAGGQPGTLQLQLTERSGRQIVSGYGEQSFTCTGQIETVTVPVPATGGERPWVAGTAYAQAQLFSCGNVFCSSAEKDGNIKLTIKKK